MKFILEIFGYSFEEFIEAKKTLDRFHDELAKLFLKKMWLEMKERFPELEQFGISLEYEYNDNTYDLDSFGMTINEYNIYSYKDYELEWNNSETNEEELTGIKWLGDVVKFWNDHRPLFDAFYNDSYSFLIQDGNVVEIKKFDNPNCEDRW